MNEDRDNGALPTARAGHEPSPAVSAVPVTIANAVIRALEDEQARLDGEDYIMDTRDCVDVIREKFCSGIGSQVRSHVMPGDPHDIGQIALQWYLGFDFGYPHSVRESNIAVEAFKDGYRAAQAMSAGTAETEGLRAKPASAVPQGCAQTLPGDHP